MTKGGGPGGPRGRGLRAAGARGGGGAHQRSRPLTASLLLFRLGGRHPRGRPGLCGGEEPRGVQRLRHPLLPQLPGERGAPGTLATRPPELEAPRARPRFGAFGACFLKLGRAACAEGRLEARSPSPRPGCQRADLGPRSARAWVCVWGGWLPRARPAWGPDALLRGVPVPSTRGQRASWDQAEDRRPGQ